jgi:ribosomal protein L24E
MLKTHHPNPQIMELSDTKKRTCIYCEKTLHGREGKMFCNVDCKNNYHSRRKAELNAKGHPNVPEILKIIKQNYKILLGYKEDVNSHKHLWFNKQELKDQGFEPRFYTSNYTDGRGEHWHCCFDMCYRSHDTYNYKLIQVINQAEIDEDNLH